MPKKRLTEIIEDYGISIEEGLELVFRELEEDMVTGRGKATWISESGQIVLEELISMPVLYRGPVLSQAPNRMYVMVYLKDITKKVAVKVPRRMLGKITPGKVIYVETDNSGPETKYHWVKTPQRG